MSTYYIYEYNSYITLVLRCAAHRCGMHIYTYYAFYRLECDPSRELRVIERRGCARARDANENLRAVLCMCIYIGRLDAPWLRRRLALRSERPRDRDNWISEERRANPIEGCAAPTLSTV